MKYTQAILLMLIPLLGAGMIPGRAVAQGQIRLETVIEMEVETVNGAGQKETYRVPVDRAAPGSPLVYSIRYSNQGPEPAANAVITTPLPANVFYQEGSAQGEDARISFSIDGGRSFHPPEALFITDASGRQFPAQPKDYTHIRWIFEKTLAPGDAGTVSYRATLK